MKKIIEVALPLDFDLEDVLIGLQMVFDGVPDENISVRELPSHEEELRGAKEHIQALIIRCRNAVKKAGDPLSATVRDAEAFLAKLKEEE